MPRRRKRRYWRFRHTPVRQPLRRQIFTRHRLPAATGTENRTHLRSSQFGSFISRYPTTGMARCCARATTGKAAARPSPAMNSRRRIRGLPRWIGGAYRGAG